MSTNFLDGCIEAMREWRMIYIYGPLVLSISFLMTGCYYYYGNTQEPPVKDYPIKPNTEFSAERFSLLSPDQKGWWVRYYKGPVPEFYAKQKHSSATIFITPYSDNPNSFKRNLKYREEEAQGFSNTAMEDRGDYINKITKRLSINGVECYKFETVSRFRSVNYVKEGTISRSTRLTCKDPQDSLTEPAILFYMSEKIDPDDEGWNAERILEDMFRSIKLLPYDKSKSRGYQHYLKVLKKQTERKNSPK